MAELARQAGRGRWWSFSEGPTTHSSAAAGRPLLSTSFDSRKPAALQLTEQVKV